jgi:sulfotransferase family protein
MDPATTQWPNLFVVGVMRGGTTTLWGYLERHPEIFMSPVKEPHFFTKAGVRRAPRYATEKAYLGLFTGASERIRGEASASYFTDGDSPAAIKRVSPDAKILVILRDPVERAHSHYWHAVNNGHETRTFAEVVRDELAGLRPDGAETYVRRGFYSEPLRRYLDHFGDNVHVLFLEELSRAPTTIMRQVFAFLEVDPGAAEDLVVERRNEFRVPRGRFAGQIHRSRRLRGTAARLVPRRLRPSVERALFATGARPAMPAESRALLADVYASDEDALQAILGRPLPWKQSPGTAGEGTRSRA